MMSQNRASDYDRLQARNDYHVNTQSKEEIRLLHEKIDHLVQQDQSDLLTIQKLQTEMIMGLANKLRRCQDDIRALKEERLERESHGNEKINLVVVTGMSGAGKTVAIQSFEDIDTSPLIICHPLWYPKVIELVKHSEETDKIALVVDMRSRLFFSMRSTIFWINWSNEELNFKILFLDATDGELVSRYKETRRSHPLAADGRVLMASS